MLASRFIFNNGNTHNGLISDPKGWSEPPKQACLHLLAACRDLTSSQSMVELHSVMSIYNVETMLGSRFIFNNGNTHNKLIFDPKGWSEPPKQACLHLLAACRDLKRSQSMVELHSIMSTYTIETMLGSFSFSTMATHTTDWYLTQKGDQSPQNKHVYTYWWPIVTWNRARAWSNYILSCLHIM